MRFLCFKCLYDISCRSCNKLAAPPAWVSSSSAPTSPCPSPILRSQTLNTTMTAMIDRCTSSPTMFAGMCVGCRVCRVFLSLDTASDKVHELESKSVPVWSPKTTREEGEFFASFVNFCCPKLWTCQRGKCE